MNAALWEDEVNTARHSNDAASVGAILVDWAQGKTGVDPPLYYVMSRLVAPSYMEPSEFRFRLVSLICSIISVPLIFFASRRLIGEPAALLAALALAVNGMAVVYAREHRSYALLMLAAIVFCHAARTLATRITAARAVYFVAAAGLMLYSHLFGVFPVASAVLVLGIAYMLWGAGEGQPVKWKFVLLTAGALLLLVMPLLWQVAVLVRVESGLGKGPEYLESALYKEYLFFGQINKPRDLWIWFSTYGAPSVLEKPMRYLSLLLLIAGVLGHWQRGARQAACLLAITLLSTALALLAYEVLRYPYQSRRLLFLLPVYVIYEAYGVMVIAGLAMRALRPQGGIASAHSLPRILAALPIAIYLLMSGVRIHFLQFRENGGLRDGDWRNIAQSIRREGERTPILFFDDKPLPYFTQFRYYRDLMIPGHPLTQVTSDMLSSDETTTSPAWAIVPNRSGWFSPDTTATLTREFFGAKLYQIDGQEN